MKSELTVVNEGVAMSLRGININKQHGTLLDANLLTRLATRQASGKTVSKAEVKSEIAMVKADLAKHYKFTTSKSAFDRAGTAIANTFALAIESGWVRAASTRDVIDAFIGGDSDSDLTGVLSEIRTEAKEARPPRSNYSSYRNSGFGS